MKNYRDLDDLRRAVEERAEELADKYSCEYELAESTVIAAIEDSMITKDSELNELFIEEYIDWELYVLNERLKREKEWLKDGGDIDSKVEEKAIREHFE